MRRGAVAAALLFLATMTGIAVGAECYLRHYFKSYTSLHGDADDMFYELAFRSFSLNAMETGLTNVTHPTRGWTPNPNLRMPGPDPVSINNRGQRSLSDYVYHPEKYTVLILGDSFTFGADAGDSEVWPTVLQSLDDRLHVINMGVSGYGIDQMYVTLTESIEEYKPQLVILAFISGDFCRAMNGFREFQKPRFRIDAENKLLLTNTPIASRPEVFKELVAKYRFPPYLFLLNIRDIVTRIHAPDTTAYKEEMLALNTRIVQQSAACAKGHDAEFLLVHLASNPATNNPNFVDDGELFMKSMEEKSGISCLGTRQAFLAAKQLWPGRHYKAPEAAVASRTIMEGIRKLDSWKSFLQRTQTSAPQPAENRPTGT